MKKSAAILLSLRFRQGPHFQIGRNMCEKKLNAPSARFRLYFSYPLFTSKKRRPGYTPSLLFIAKLWPDKGEKI